jgi:hypothetical protein
MTACPAAVLPSTLSECMFECSSSACLPLGGEAAPVWCLCQGAGACEVSAASRWRSGCGTAGPQGSSGAGGCTRSSSSWSGRSGPLRRRPTLDRAARQAADRQQATRRPAARQPVARNPAARNPAARNPAALRVASAGALRRLQGGACRQLPTSSAAIWHPGAGCCPVPDYQPIWGCLGVSREAVVRFPYCIRV